MLQFTNSLGKIIKIDENKEIARGGEGRIILLSGKKQVAKLYFNAQPLDSSAHFKFLMNWQHPLFLLPDDLLFDAKRNIAGFLMPFLPDSYQALSILFSKNYCRKNNIDGQFKLKLIEKLIIAVKEAHENQLIIGDLNPYNIMVHTKTGELKFIDCDSYQTPHKKHSGVLLEDIRDYEKGGKVSQESDFFALSVLSFYLLSFCHPFKGIHPQFKTLKERMLHHLPIFESSVKKPKCFVQPDDSWMTIFNDFYLNDKRFLFSTQNLAADTGQFVTHEMKINENILLQTVYSGAYRGVEFGARFGYVATPTEWKLYECIEKGRIVLRKSYPLTNFDAIFISDEHIIGRKDTNWYFGLEHDTKKIKNISLKADKIVLYKNLAAIIEDGALYKLYINEIRYGNIKIERIEVFEEGFKQQPNWIQLSGGVYHIFNSNKNDLSTIKLKRKIISLEQKGAYGLYSFKQKGQLKYRFFHIKGLNLKEYTETYDEPFQFAVLEANKDYIFKTKDDGIELLSTENLQKMEEYKIEGFDAQNPIFYSHSGIVLSTDQGILLMNKK